MGMIAAQATRGKQGKKQSFRGGAESPPQGATTPPPNITPVLFCTQGEVNTRGMAESLSKKGALDMRSAIQAAPETPSLRPGTFLEGVTCFSIGGNPGVVGNLSQILTWRHPDWRAV